MRKALSAFIAILTVSLLLSCNGQIQTKEDMPLTDEEIVNVTAQLHSYIFNYIPNKYDADNPFPETICRDHETRELRFTNHYEDEFFSVPTTINGTVNPNSELIRVAVNDFIINGTAYDIEFDVTAENSPIFWQVSHVYITEDGTRYSYNYLTDEISKANLRIYVASVMAGTPVDGELSTLTGTEQKGEKVIYLHDVKDNPVYSGQIIFSFTDMTFMADFTIENPDLTVTFKGSGNLSQGTVTDNNGITYIVYNFNWTSADLGHLGKCSEAELKYINEIIDVWYDAEMK